MILKKTQRLLLLLTAFFAINACKESPKESTAIVDTKPSVIAPTFNADSAFLFVEKQVAFGPRVPNTASHKKTAMWIINELKGSGLEVIEQDFKATTYDNKTLDAKNIIASYNPAATKRILLAAHWDSRPFADKDDERKTEAIAGANDGGSGVAVLLEIARTIAAAEIKPTVGIDFIFFDAEDWGTPEGYTGTTDLEYGGYCLGSEYWSKNLHKPNYSAYFGILFDMVGAKGATFRQEGYSMQIAPSVVQNVWNTASQLGFSQFFVNEKMDGGITDDHVPVIQNAKIPMIDIIDLKRTENTFFAGHHTHDDDMSVIDKNTLKAVGQTVLQVLYQE
ncbi:MAG: M28 family peptidase [Spirosomaceae bacterium]|nr:M28 family peptidase [Spirosomataceae bacterium]